MPPLFGGLNIQKHSNWSFEHASPWSQDVKTCEFEVLRSKNFEFEGFNILGLSVRLAECWKLRFEWLRFGGLGIQKHPNRIFYHPGAWPRMLKPSNSRFWGPKTSNSKVLTSWSHMLGWLNAKNFDLGCHTFGGLGNLKHSNRSF